MDLLGNCQLCPTPIYAPACFQVLYLIQFLASQPEVKCAVHVALSKIAYKPVQDRTRTFLGQCEVPKSGTLCTTNLAKQTTGAKSLLLVQYISYILWVLTLFPLSYVQ